MNRILFILVIMAALCNCSNSSEQTQSALKIDLSNFNWEFKQVDTCCWMPATVPGTVHTDLMANDSIGDSFYRLNEKKQQWIDKVDWEYKTTFNVDIKMLSNKHIELTFEGLDTYAKVSLNGKEILSSDNMFRANKINVDDLLTEGENTLHIVFESPVNKGLELLKANGYQYPANNDQSENGELGAKKVSTFVRKAPYHFGWDWGPRLVTSGIWKPIFLTAWNEAKIEDLYVEQININKDNALISFNLEIDSDKAEKVDYVIRNKSDDRILESGQLELKEGENIFKNETTILKPKLWWPNGYGEQSMYEFSFELYKGIELIAEKQVKTGLRSVKVIREKDDQGAGFYFEVNGVPVFAKGANYIPNDNFLTRVTNEKYKHILQSAVDANMNMLRVWGGGIYEYDVFYEMCDSLGLMLWQDFMFACSMYPGNNDFLKSIELEAIDNVKRLRNHPSIALWCGNNEIEGAWAEGREEAGWGWKQQYNDKQRKEIWQTYDTIFYSILPKVVANNHSEIFYWPSSPVADFKEIATYDTKAGDMHYWGVWHGLEKFERFNEVIPRFMSEYGFQSFPDFQSVKKYTSEEDWDIESDVMASHQRSGIGNLRIKEYMGWDYKIPANFEQFLYVGQVLQAEGMRMGMEAHRRNKPFCMGTLYWQLNDCWPVASWSGMDYYGKWKALHYFVKKAYEPYLISMLEKGDNLEIWVVSDKLENIDSKLKVQLMDFEGKVLMNKKIEVNIKGNTSALAMKIAMKDIKNLDASNNMVLHAELMDETLSLAVNQFYFEKPKDMNLKQGKPNFTFENGTLEISSSLLIKNLYVYTESEDVFSDNYFDVLPGIKYVIQVESESFTLDKLKYISIADTY
ncbi:MAG: glycoside hydrolase family 2 protein [Salinivirgaceae bacterium]|jgi:beta-mannosidase|nr:glycoside hydrolase family 2 protein [Salinivirgaceae bacterium]